MLWGEPGPRWFCFWFWLLRWGLEGGGSDAIFFHSPIEGSAAEAEGFGRLAHVAVAAGEGFADEDTLDGLEGHLFEGLGGDAGGGEAEVGESILIRKALSRCNGNVSQAAEALGLSRGALYRRMEKYGV